MYHRVPIKNILKYLRRTKDVFLIYGDGDLIVNGYNDTSFQSNRDNYKSQLDYEFALNDDTVSWKSSKQVMIVDSITESEYIDASDDSLRKRFGQVSSFMNYKWSLTLLIR